MSRYEFVDDQNREWAVGFDTVMASYLADWNYPGDPDNVTELVDPLKVGAVTTFAELDELVTTHGAAIPGEIALKLQVDEPFDPQKAAAEASARHAVNLASWGASALVSIDTSAGSQSPARAPEPERERDGDLGR